MSELKPCPFCGGNDTRHTNKTTDNGRKRHIAFYCNTCHAYGPRVLVRTPDRGYVRDDERSIMPYSLGGVEAWNTRKEDQRIKDLEALLLESKDMAVDLLNYVESSGWTRHRDNEIAETKAYIEKVDKALGNI